MQGTVWGSLPCPSTIDTFGKKWFEEREKLYHYKGIPIQPLGIVDDVLSVTNVEQTKIMNETINTLIESKKLKLSETKCYQIHIEKGHKGCPNLKVHDTDMKQLSQKNILVTLSTILEAFKLQ